METPMAICTPLGCNDDLGSHRNVWVFTKPFLVEFLRLLQACLSHMRGDRVRVLMPGLSIALALSTDLLAK